MLAIEEASAAAIGRPEGKLNYETTVIYVKHFLDESMRQMRDGFGLNLFYCSLHPGASCTVDTEHEEIKLEDHEITVRFRERQPLRDLMKEVKIEVAGIAESGAYIDEFIDVETGTINEKAMPGGQFIINGGKEKIEGDECETGIYFKSQGAPAINTKVMKKLAKNDPSELIGTLPDLPASKTWELEIRMRYSNQSTLLKEVRVIKAGFTIAT
jgi:hypothetical protein